MAFHPAELAVARGDTVVWINRDIVPHSATAATGAGDWDTGILASAERGQLVARRPGTMAYVCTLHPNMRGTLIVH